MAQLPETMDITVSASEAMASITANVRLTGMRLVRLRIMLAMPFIWLACRIAGMGLEIEDE